MKFKCLIGKKIAPVGLLALLLGCVSIGIGMSSSARAESLLMRNVERSLDMNVPQRGMSMATVERRFGKPRQILPTVGGDAPRHPPINRWRYDDYTVVFERNRVIHTVIGAIAGR